MCHGKKDIKSETKLTPAQLLSILVATALIACYIAANACQFLHLGIKGLMGWWIISFLIVLAAGFNVAGQILTWRQCHAKN